MIRPEMKAVTHWWRVAVTAYIEFWPASMRNGLITASCDCSTEQVYM
jgi:hypothetical protein